MVLTLGRSIRSLLIVASSVAVGAVSAERVGAQSSTMPTYQGEIVNVKPLREGMWFNVGLGAGSAGCKECSNNRVSGLSGGLAIGGTISQLVQLGAQTAGFVTQQNGATLNVGSVNAVVRFYPSAEGRFFLLGGLGMGTATYDDGSGQVSASGSAAILGLGYDVPLNGSVNLTPFWNGYAVAVNGSTIDVGQLGIGITIH